MRAAAILPAALLAFLASAPAGAAAPVTGRWLTEDGKAIVTIAPCGSAICGRVTTILAPMPKGPPLDEHNPDHTLRKRPVKGLTVLLAFVDKGKDWRGRIYSPEEGKEYRAILKRTAKGLQVSGCFFFLCKTQIWQPAP